MRLDGYVCDDRAKKEDQYHTSIVGEKKQEGYKGASGRQVLNIPDEMENNRIFSAERSTVGVGVFQG